MAKNITFVYRNIDRNSIDLAESLMLPKEVTAGDLEILFRNRLESIDIQDDVSLVGVLHVKRGSIVWLLPTDEA